MMNDFNDVSVLNIVVCNGSLSTRQHRAFVQESLSFRRDTCLGLDSCSYSTKMICRGHFDGNRLTIKILHSEQESHVCDEKQK